MNKTDPIAANPKERRASLGIGCLAMLLLILVIPAFYFVVSLPFSLTKLAEWLYFVSALVFPSAIAAGLHPLPSLSKMFARALLIYLAIAAPALIMFGAFAVLVNEMTVVTTEEQLASSDGRLVLVHDYIDQGALGGSSHVYIRARFVPGLVNWEFDVDPSMERPTDLAWIDGEHVSVDGRVYAIPWAMSRLAW